MLKLTVKPGEYILVGNDIKVVFAGGSANNMRILIDAPKSMNIARSAALEKYKEVEEPGNMVHHYKDKELSKEAKEKIREASIFLSENELRKQLRDTTDARNLIEKAGTPPLQNVSEAKDILLSAAKEECLTPYQLERVEKVLVAVMRLKDYLSRGKSYGNLLGYYEENLDALENIREEIRKQIRGGEVDDYASKELQQLRSQIIKM